MQLLQDGNWAAGGAYALFSCVLCIAGAFAGNAAARFLAPGA